MNSYYKQQELLITQKYIKWKKTDTKKYTLCGFMT